MGLAFSTSMGLPHSIKFGTYVSNPDTEEEKGSSLTTTAIESPAGCPHRRTHKSRRTRQSGPVIHEADQLRARDDSNGIVAVEFYWGTFGHYRVTVAQN